MALRFELVTDKIKEMGEKAAQQKELSADLILLFERKIKAAGVDWKLIDHALKRVLDGVDKQRFRTGRPLTEQEPMHLGIDAPPPPERATVIAVDGSQAITSRHSPYQYYLINIGAILYEHGVNATPKEVYQPELFYVGDTAQTTDDHFTASHVNAERDKREISTLAQLAQVHRAEHLVIAILDQRLQYRPIDRQNKSQTYIDHWIDQMGTIQQTGAHLIGYIERPETAAIITLLTALDWGTEHLRPEWLEKPPLEDAALFRHLLKEGQRSCLFKVVNESTGYSPYRHAQQEICFFYYKPSGLGDVSRIDLPLWVAEKQDNVERIHGMIHHQAKLLGGYPYVLTRADEVAVVTHKDQQYLDQLIGIEMMRQGINAQTTGKQLGKELTRSG